jgi:hypothetical protein
MMRGSCAVVIFPKFALFSEVVGALKFVWFNALKISQRSWIPRVFANRMLRVSARSFVSLDGFTIENGASVLYVPVAGEPNAARFR